MGLGPVCWTSLSTGLSEWELGPHHAEQSPITLIFLKIVFAALGPCILDDF